MPHPTIALIEQRVSARRFDPSHVLTRIEIEELVRLATRAPTAFNLQNWRFIAVLTPEAKMKLRHFAYDHLKISDAAVTFIICGQSPDYATVSERLRPAVESGLMTEAMASEWQEEARAKYDDNPKAARDEAIRSAALGTATLIYAAEAMDLKSGSMGGFDADAVSHEFGLAPSEIPVMLVAVGRAAPGNWSQKPRRPLSEVLRIS